ncbi:MULTISPECIES: FAD:protein FMN transferase [Halomonas]|uniref:FAD:protein FMN transferase n=1 Tax=Halomonas ventosae TaxID=229007 RepID=A0A4R6HD68_9GAMM|nr:FAD:protein FMN transferase [Halomonas ventosae]TDO06027.1 thiamine biosynthesis lipoprotein [Halomonas ventosae]
MSVCRPLWLLLLIVLLAGCSERDRPLDSPVTLKGEVFGTFYQVTIADPLTRRELEALETGILAEMASVDAAMSTWRKDSELVLFNQAPLGEWQSLSDELIEVMAIGQAVSEASGGAFDMTIGGLVNLWSFGPEARPREVPDDATLSKRLAKIGPGSLEIDEQALQARRLRDVFVDLSGVAKGHATDRVAAYLTRQEIDHYLVNIGGELKVAGFRDGESSPWRIGIEVPRDGPQQAQQILPLNDMALATSGDYRNYFEEDGQRYSHTIDPRTGRPIDHRLASVSVFMSSDAWADAWATALMVLGEEEGMALARERNLAVLMLVRQGEGWATWVSPAFVDRFGHEIVDNFDMTVADGPTSA